MGASQGISGSSKSRLTTSQNEIYIAPMGARTVVKRGARQSNTMAIAGPQDRTLHGFAKRQASAWIGRALEVDRRFVSSEASSRAGAADPPSAQKGNSMTVSATVFVVDDNLGVRKSLRALLESAGLEVETYASGEELLATYDPLRPGCVVLDVRLRHGNGLDLQDELRRRNARLPIIVLTGHGNVPTSVRALKAGAVDFLQKPAPPKLLLERIRAAIESDRQARAATTARAVVSARIANLTPREREVMEHLLAGRTSKETAVAMNLSVRTVEGHRRMVFLKMDVSSAAQLVRTVMPVREAESRA